MAKLTPKFMVDITLPSQGQVFYRDQDLKGFGIRATPGSLAYIVEAKVNGKTTRMTLGRCDLIPLEDARALAKEALRAMAAGKMNHSGRADMTLQEVLDQYLLEKTLRPTTVYLTRMILKRCVGDWLPMPLSSITSQMILQRHKELPHLTICGTTGHVQANTCIRILSRLFNFAINHLETPEGLPLFTANPVQKLIQKKAWYPEPIRHTVIPDHKLSAWFRGILALDRDQKDYLLFLILTGLRRGETAQLKWSDIDFDLKTLTISPEVTKNKQWHTLPLTGFLEEFLLRRRGVSTGQWVFGDDSPFKWSMKAHARLIRKTGVQFVLHDLRRSFLSMAAKLNVNFQLIRKLANHTSRTDITQGYIYFHPEHLMDPLELVGKRLLELMEFDPDLFWLPERPKVKAERLTLRQVFDAYVQTKNLRPNTARHYDDLVRLNLGDWLDLEIQEITPALVKTRYQRITGRAVCQANNTMSLLTTLLNFAKAHFELAAGPVLVTNPVSGLPRQIAPETRREVAIPDHKLADWYQAVQKLSNTSVRDYLVTLMFTGLWPVEARTLRWSDIDLEGRTLNISAEHSFGGRAHQLPLSDFLLDLLVSRSFQRSSKGHVFPGNGGLSHIIDTRWMIKLVRDDSAVSFRSNDLRKTFLSVATKLELPAPMIKTFANGGGEFVPVPLEQLREPMERITTRLILLIGNGDESEKDCVALVRS